MINDEKQLKLKKKSNMMTIMQMCVIQTAVRLGEPQKQETTQTSDPLQTVADGSQ